MLRFNPRPDAGELLTRSLTIEPEPAFREDVADPFGNRVTRALFPGSTERLSIDSRFALETRDRPPPADVDPPLLPWSLPGGRSLPAAYLGEGGIDGASAAFAAELAADCGGKALVFLDRLNTKLFKTIRHDIRDDGAARRPEETLALGHGACRDVTILFLAACRSLGAPARFVSGYQAKADTPDGRRHLHAWAEAFVPGLGWLRLRSDPWAFGDRRPCRAFGRPEPSRDHAGRRRLLCRRPVASRLSYQVEIATD